MNRYSVQELNAETDADVVCSLWARNLASGSVEHAKDKLQQGYVANPAANGALFAVRREGDSALAGVIGLHPRRFCCGDQAFSAATLADFSVDGAHRSAGPALMLMRKAIGTGRERFSLIFGIPNTQSYAICRRAGMSTLGTLTNYTLVRDSRQRLAQRIHHRWLPLAAPVVDLALSCRRSWKSLGQRPVLIGRDATFDDAALDSIWASRPASLLVSERSASMLRWRYCRKDSRHWRITIMQQPGGADCGYVIWHLNNGRAVIGDFFSTDPAHLTAPLLISHARLVLGMGVHSISASFLGTDSVSSAFLQAGYFLAETPGDRVLVAKDMAFGEVTLSTLYLTTYDNDD